MLRLYSVLNDFTGLAKAALMLWKLAVSSAMAITTMPARANIHQAISIRY
jgi:hypothetical protein